MSSPKTYALRLIKTRLRSAWEIDQALLVRGVESDERQAVIDELTTHKLLDDSRYARAWVHTRDRLSPRGEKMLRLELQAKHISKEIIAEVLQERRDTVDDDEVEQLSEDELARKLVEGKMRAYAHLTPDVRNRRLTGVLLRRGFSYDVARRILGA